MWAIRPLLEEVYTLLNQQELVDDIKLGRYEIQTDDGATIIPSVWSAIVKPSSKIQIDFRSDRPIGRRRSTQDAESVIETRDVRVTINADSPEFALSNSEVSDSNGDESEDDSESQSSTESEDEASEQAVLPEPVRDAAPPLDAEGNKLSFSVDTSCAKAIQRPKDPKINGVNSKVPSSQKDASDTYVETLRITRATSTVVESRSLIQIHTLPSTDNIHLRESASMTWFHIPATRLDYSRFRDVCLAVPHLSDRLYTLIWETFKAIEKDKIKAFLDGMFIEPGTVIRADEKGQAESQSVIFSCIPYFDLQPPAKKLATGQGDRLFPSRTLMQSYYPYEPVRDRDAEQAYRKFGTDRSGSVVNVPNMWTMNIGTDIVVTCGHKPLSQELIRSMEVIQEDLAHVGTKDITNNPLTRLRLRDWDGRVLLFPLNACRSYFQMEQRLRELNWTVRGRMDRRRLRLVQRTSDGEKNVAVKGWMDIIRQTDLIFIDLGVVDDAKAKEPQPEPPEEDISNLLTPSSTTLVPPFFLWPSASLGGMSNDMEAAPESTPSRVKRSMYCLEHAEKGMRSETLDVYDTVNEVDKTFTSTSYYRSLPELTHSDVLAAFSSLRHRPVQVEGAASSSHTHHQAIISTQCTGIVERSSKFFKIVYATFKLFVEDVDENALLRKTWSAMSNIPKLAAAIKDRGALNPGKNEPSDSFQKRPLMGDGGEWFIRYNVKDGVSPAPEADKKFKRAVARCNRCQSFAPFSSREAAIEHLQKHLRPGSHTQHVEPATTSSALPASDQSQPGSALAPTLNDWVVNSELLKREETNAGALAILRQACETAKDLFIQSRELADGVQNEDGTMSELYTLPRQLVEAFRSIAVFYLAIERALHHTEETYQNYDVLEATDDLSQRPYSEQGLEVLKRFGEGARRSLMMARAELCSMVASTTPFDILEHLSLGPEYVCAWLMRRLLVKPLQEHMTVGDMYREYLSTIQFQVNHRPGKRLLRSINLLQEELQVLSEVTTWQTKLIQNYMRVLDDSTYEKDMPPRRVMFPYERVLLRSCLDALDLTSEEYAELLRRCGPLSDSTKQSLEINEEDHGKAIMVFTTVTVIFLPLSFVTSYLGMNTADIRDMESLQSLFWIVALPLTLVTMATCLVVGYNGDEIRDAVAGAYRRVSGKQDRSTAARGISVAQRKRAGGRIQGTSSTSSSSPSASGGNNSQLDAAASNTFADDAEYANPRPEYAAGGGMDRYGSLRRRAATTPFTSSYPYPPPPPPPEPIVIEEQQQPVALGDMLFETRAAAPASYAKVQSFAEHIPISPPPLPSPPQNRRQALPTYNYEMPERRVRGPYGMPGPGPSTSRRRRGPDVYDRRVERVGDGGDEEREEDEIREYTWHRRRRGHEHDGGREQRRRIWREDMEADRRAEERRRGR
ncbi:hypothetical protein N0V83_010459 [Neocucurbitaria cava]|uniref:Uncharacterized protein n=1 Tax=Neocucurbitaria cava TaxID=798079 RepID=A0A9W8XYD8_9PLEO|nr:hypothetical protein N0V83_010459 [Neocucurbitaria cava]